MRFFLKKIESKSTDIDIERQYIKTKIIKNIKENLGLFYIHKI